jgi:hypothetical protein
MTHRGRLRSRTLRLPRSHAAAARSFHQAVGFEQSKKRRTHSRRDWPFGARFTLTRNEGLISEMGYHGASWASTGTGFPNPFEGEIAGTAVFILY